MVQTTRHMTESRPSRQPSQPPRGRTPAWLAKKKWAARVIPSDRAELGWVSTPAAFVGVQSALRLLKFGRSRFELETLPGTIGGDLAGTVVANRRLAEVPHLLAALRCDLTERRGAGKSRFEYTAHLWRAEHTLTGPFAVARDRTRVPASDE
jgi:hypothetical protein